MLNSNSCDLNNEVDRYAVLLVRKCLNWNVRSNFKDSFKINEHHLEARNRNILLQIPKVKLGIAKNGFFYMGAKLYNLLLINIKESADEFENRFSSFFILQLKAFNDYKNKCISFIFFVLFKGRMLIAVFVQSDMVILLKYSQRNIQLSSTPLVQSFPSYQLQRFLLSLLPTTVFFVLSATFVHSFAFLFHN